MALSAISTSHWLTWSGSGLVVAECANLSFVILQIFVFCGSATLLFLSVVGLQRASIGLELSDVLPEHTAPAKFLQARDKYFRLGFCNQCYWFVLFTVSIQCLRFLKDLISITHANNIRLRTTDELFVSVWFLFIISLLFSFVEVCYQDRNWGTFREVLAVDDERLALEHPKRLWWRVQQWPHRCWR